MTLESQCGADDRPVIPLPEQILPLPKIIFTDVDDTLTCDGLLPEETFTALYKLQQSGFAVVPVTGASAGWCDCLIKTWPIQHIVGENGALTMEKDEFGVVSTHYVKDAASVQQDLVKLKHIGTELTNNFPKIRYTQDQQFRLTDIAFDIGQTVRIEESMAVKATEWLQAQAVQARRSSIHINVWIGDHSKSSGAINWLKQRNLSEQSCLFIGDSPNDESMFKQFPLSVGVANIDRFLEDMDHRPAYITPGKGGYGFVDMAEVLFRTQNALRVG